MEQNDFSHLSDELSTRELAEVMAAARATGMVAQMTFVDDPESPEGRQAVDTSTAITGCREITAPCRAVKSKHWGKS